MADSLLAEVVSPDSGPLMLGYPVTVALEYVQEYSTCRRAVIGAVGVHHGARLGSHGLADGADVVGLRRPTPSSTPKPNYGDRRLYSSKFVEQVFYEVGWIEG